MVRVTPPPWRRKAVSQNGECSNVIIEWYRIPNSPDTGAGTAAPRPKTPTSVGRRHHDDPRHHAPVLVLEDVAVIDEFPELRERDVEDLRRRRALVCAPLRDSADPVLVR